MANHILRFAVVIVLGSYLAYTVYAQSVNCTASGAGRYADTTDTTCQNYTLCVSAPNGTFVSYEYTCPTNAVFNPTSAQCTAAANYVCTNTNVCTANGFVANPAVANCSSYIQCVLINNAYTQTTFTCPTGTNYNPNSTLCDPNYTCPAAAAVTTTTAAPAAAFNCATVGRFANTADTTCQSYYYCVLAANGTFLQYRYTCPTTSVFSPTSRQCTTAYTCPTAAG